MSYDILFNNALHWFDNGDFDKAEAIARQIYETMPSNPEVLNLLGIIAQAKGIHKNAISYFLAALREKPNTVSFFYNLAFSLKADGQFAEALLYFSKVLELAPQVKETHNEMACIYEETGNLTEAREHWNAAIKLDDGYLIAKINLANSYRAENPDKAVEELLKLENMAENEALLWYDLAWLYYNKQSFKKTLDYIQKAETLSPYSDAIFYLKGLCFLEKGNVSEAQKAFEKAEEYNQLNYDAILCLADIYSKKSCFEMAENRYKTVIENNPKNFTAHANYAEMLYRQKRNIEAMEEYRKAVINNPKSPELSNNLGAVLKDMGEFDEALGLFFNALSLNPNLNEISVNIWETLVLLAAKDEEKAIKIADNWQKSYPDNPFAKFAKNIMEGKNAENCEVFVERLFDNFADNYELVMQNLAYSAPLAIGRIAGYLEGRVADLGCGSGFVGKNIKNDKNYIIGVDLSAKMLEKAAEKKVYDELVKADILDFLKNRNDFETIVAADVLGYIPNIEKFVELCRGKKIIFTVETDDEAANSVISKAGRIKYNHAYIKNLLNEKGFKNIKEEKLVLRQENGEPVAGMIFEAK